MLEQDKLDTAALIALEIQDRGFGRLRLFREKWIEIYGSSGSGLTDLMAARPYYEAFFGFDGRTWPTHDMNTGRRF